MRLNDTGVGAAGLDEVSLRRLRRNAPASTPMMRLQDLLAHEYERLCAVRDRRGSDVDDSAGTPDIWDGGDAA
jgi:hypothetical protein